MIRAGEKVRRLLAIATIPDRSPRINQSALLSTSPEKDRAENDTPDTTIVKNTAGISSTTSTSVIPREGVVEGVGEFVGVLERDAVEVVDGVRAEDGDEMGGWVMLRVEKEDWEGPCVSTDSTVDQGLALEDNKGVVVNGRVKDGEMKED